MKKSISIETMFAEHPFYDRFRLVREAGLDFLEFGEWTELDFSRVNELQKEYALRIAAISGTSRFSFVRPEDREGFLEHLSQSVAVARSFGCQNLLLDPGPGAGQNVAAGVEALMKVAARAERFGVTLLLKPVGADHDSAAEAARKVGSPNVRLLCDVTGIWAAGGDAAGVLRKHRDLLGYVHVGDAPGAPRSACEADLPAIRRVLADELAYDGHVGFAFNPGEDLEGCLRAIRNF